MDYLDLFDAQMEPSSPVVKLLVSIADAAVSAVAPQVIGKAFTFADSKDIPKKSIANVEAIGRDFQMVIPAAGRATLTDLVNAGWQCSHDGNLWSQVAQIQKEDRSRVLYDLVLKSFEVAEYSERISAP